MNQEKRRDRAKRKAAHAQMLKHHSKKRIRGLKADIKELNRKLGIR